MDEMAATLTGKDTADEAWATVFRKPDAKEWSDVKVFLKTNGTIESIMAHIPITSKVCEELIKLGVRGENIIISDPGRGAFGPTKYTPYTGGNGLPEGVKVSEECYPDVATDRTGGKTYGIPVGDQLIFASPDIATGEPGNIAYMADIIVNLAVNKGHVGKAWIGDVTLSMKNHVGTFALKVSESGDDCPGDRDFNGGQKGSDFLIKINQSEAILGSGPGYPVRQQLVIMDNLWASKQGPHIGPDCPPQGILAMGTCSASVDWLVHKHVRQEIMGVTTDNEPTLVEFLDAFGYNTGELEWIEAQPIPEPIGTTPGTGSEAGRKVTIMIADGQFASSPVTFILPGKDAGTARISIHDLKGKLVRNLGRIGSRAHVLWDGFGRNGSIVPAGKYAVRVVNSGFSKSGIMTFQGI
jgi:hypothetical protein